jgi:hypothetical protein
MLCTEIEIAQPILRDQIHDQLKNSDLLNLAAKRLYFQDHQTRILPKFTIVCPQIHRGRI